MHQDPREELLKYAEESAKNPKYVGHSFYQNDPEKLMATKTAEQEAEEAEEARRRMLD